MTSRPSAQVLFSCTTTADLGEKGNVDGVSLTPLLDVGQVNTVGRTFASPVESAGNTEVQKVSLLDGLITADDLLSASSTTESKSGFLTSSEGTLFTALQIAGKSFPDQVEPNTVIDLDGFGYIIVNEQTSMAGAFAASLSVNALHLVITQENKLEVPVGTNVVLADATSGLAGPVVGTVGGKAFGTRVSVPGVLQTGAIHTTAQGTLDGLEASGQTTAWIDDADLLKELVVAKGIYSDANASTDGKAASFNDGKSGFEYLSVSGYPEIDANVPANTRLAIDGLGVLWLHRVLQTPTSIDVRMIELVVTMDNAWGLPIGTRVRIAVSHAIAR